MQITHHGLPDHLVGPYTALRRQALTKLLADERERTVLVIKSRSPKTIANLVVGVMSACLAKTLTQDGPIPARILCPVANELIAHVLDVMEEADQQPVSAIFRVECVDAVFNSVMLVIDSIKGQPNDLEVAP